MADEQKPTTSPWQQNWIEKPIQAVVETFNKIKDGAQGGKMPWELDWTEKATQAPPKQNKTPVEPSGGFQMAKYLNTLSAVESGGNPNAKAKTSSATGLYQFTDKTWLETVAKLDLPYTLKDRTDPQKSKEVVTAFTQANINKAKKDLGREPTMLDAYIYHFAGGRSAPKLLNADPQSPAIEHVTKAQAKANKSVFYSEDGKPRTVGQVLQRFKNKFGD